MQVQPRTVSRLRRTERSLRGLADALRNRVRHQERPGPHHEQASPSKKPHKYQALVTLYPPGDGGLDAEPLLHVRHMAVRPNHGGQIFSALVSVEDGSPLRPGTANIITRMVVLGDDARDYLAPGEQFALLSGSEVGRGVVSRWMFT